MRCYAGEAWGSSPGPATGLSCMTPLSGSLRINFGSAGGSSGEGDAAELGEVGLRRSGETGMESFVVLRLEPKSMTGVWRAWNCVRESDSSPSCGNEGDEWSAHGNRSRGQHKTSEPYS